MIMKKESKSLVRILCVPALSIENKKMIYIFNIFRFDPRKDSKPYGRNSG
jgi:hypothetical protein